MRVLGIETSCDETGVALYDTERGLVADALHSQVALHEAYGGVVPELASRDHVRRVLPLVEDVLRRAGITVRDVDAIAYTRGPGLAGALLVGAGIATSLAFGLGKPVVGIHHLEGHLLSPLLASPAPAFPFVALLVSGGHTQWYDVQGPGRYELLGDTQDDAAGEAFDKTAKLLGLGLPGGPALAALADQGDPEAIVLPRPMIDSGTLDMSFSGLKTAVLLRAREAARSTTSEMGPDSISRETGSHPIPDTASLPAAVKADIAAGFQAAVVDVLVAKAQLALDLTGRTSLVVAGGVGANRRLRAALVDALERRNARVHFPEPRLCTDNGAMIAMAAAMRLGDARRDYAFSVLPRWALADN
jgi:tRNA N6-adenosine threonylcarbamoyltransferase